MRPAADPAQLLAWYDASARDLPWRVPAGTADPYLVWLSEIMLQQTTVAAVIPYFERFRARWPTVEALAAAPIDAVTEAWAGLGYYSRARNLHACARVVADELAGAFPRTAKALEALPGIGPYTAGAIAAIAYDEPVPVVDGNVERVIARIFAIETPLPAAKPLIRERTAALVPAERPGDFAQAMMDLGATVCTPKKPACFLCPWRSSCAALAIGTPEAFPHLADKKARPVRRGIAYWIESDGAVLLRRRPPKGLLGGMLEVPSGPWEAREKREAFAAGAVTAGAPVSADWHLLGGIVTHTFTHFHLELAVAATRLDERPDLDGEWVRREGLGERGLPTVMRKIVRHALSALG